MNISRSDVAECFLYFDVACQEIPGEAGLDYPVLASVPDTDFSCDNRVSGGYYADTQTACQARAEQ